MIGTPLLLLLALSGAGDAPMVRFQAHRGGLHEVPENTLPAFDHAWAIPGAVPEMDLRTTQDGVIVCLHDDTPKRTTNAPAPWDETKVREIPYEVLRAWDAGSHFDARYAGTHVPTLDKVFMQMENNPEQQAYLDLKDVDLDAVVARIRQFGLEEQIIFVHGDPAMCARLAKLYDGARTMTWISGAPDDPRAFRKALDGVRS